MGRRDSDTQLLRDGTLRLGSLQCMVMLREHADRCVILDLLSKPLPESRAENGCEDCVLLSAEVDSISRKHPLRRSRRLRSTKGPTLALGQISDFDLVLHRRLLCIQQSDEIHGRPPSQHSRPVVSVPSNSHTHQRSVGAGQSRSQQCWRSATGQPHRVVATGTLGVAVCGADHRVQDPRLRRGHECGVDVGILRFVVRSKGSHCAIEGEREEE